MIPQFDFTSPRSRQRIAMMLQKLALGEATRADLGMASSSSSSTTTLFLRHLIEAGSVKCVRDFKKAVGVSLPAVYALVEGTVIPEMPARVRKAQKLPAWRPTFGERRVTVLTSWTPLAIPQQSPFSALGL